MKRHPLIPIALTLALAAACAPNPQSMGPNVPTTTTQTTQPTRSHSQRYPIKFKVENPANFRVQQVEPTFARLQIDGAGGDVEIVNGDANGFIPITSETTMVEANVPAGENIAVSLSMHLSDDPDSPPTATIGGVFHIDENATPETPQEVELSFPGELVAQLVRQLRQSAGTGFDPTVPIDFETYKSFALAILNKMPLGRQNPSDVEITTLAELISSEALRVDEETVTQLQNAGTLKMTEGQSRRVDQTLGNTPVVVTHSFPSNMDAEVNPGTRQMPPGFTGAITRLSLTSNQGSADVIGLDYREGSLNYMFSFKPATDLSAKYGTTLIPHYAPNSKQAFHSAQVGALAVGSYDPDPNVKGDALRTTYITERNNSDLVIKAVAPRDPATIYWTYTLTGAAQSNSYFTPVIWPSKWQATGCSCDDRDIIYIVHGANLYALTQGTGPSNQGVELWRKNLGSESVQAASLSHTGKTLYLTLTSRPAKIVALRVDPYETWDQGGNPTPPTEGLGTELWSHELPGSVGLSSSVSIGSDGTLYTGSTFDYSDTTKGYLVAIDPALTPTNGREKWRRETIGQINHSPVIDRPTGAQVDHIYTVSSLGRMYGYTSEGNSRWEPFIFQGPMYDASSSALIAEDPQGDRVVYTSRGNGLVYALQVPISGAAPYLLWSRTPSGSIKNNMVLQDNYLYTSTLNGGEGQILKFQALHVHTPRIAQTAPWPVGHGRQTDSGLSHISSTLGSFQAPGI
jgi:hypothetical protein